MAVSFYTSAPAARVAAPYEGTAKNGLICFLVFVCHYNALFNRQWRYAMKKLLLNALIVSGVLSGCVRGSEDVVTGGAGAAAAAAAGVVLHYSRPLDDYFKDNLEGSRSLLELEPFVGDILEKAFDYSPEDKEKVGYSGLLTALALSGSPTLMSEIFSGALEAFPVECLSPELHILGRYYDLFKVDSIIVPLEWRCKLLSKDGVTHFLHYFCSIKGSFLEEQTEALSLLNEKVRKLSESCRCLTGEQKFQLSRTDYSQVIGCLTSVRILLWAADTVFDAESVPSHLSISSYDEIKKLCSYPLIDGIEHVFCLRERVE